MVSSIFYFQPYLGKWSNLTNIFQMAWNHPLVFIGMKEYSNLEKDLKDVLSQKNWKLWISIGILETHEVGIPFVSNQW